jgi:sulfur carrier protein
LIYIQPGAYDVASMNTITLEINGETRTIPPVSNVTELLEVLGISGSRAAVEINRKIIRRGEWESTPISNLDRVEIVQFVGGG